MPDSPLKPLVDSTLDVLEGVFYLSLTDTKGWAKTNALWHFVYALRVFRSWMVDDFQTEFEKHKHLALASANEGFRLEEVHHHSPLHALAYWAERARETFEGFDRYADLKSLPLTLSTRSVLPSARPSAVPNGRGKKNASYQSLFEDVLDAWPVTRRAPGAPRQSYKASTLESIDPKTGRKVDGEDLVEETIAKIKKLRNVNKTDEIMAGKLSHDQWVSLQNLWVTSDVIEQWFEDLKSSLKKIDLPAWWGSIDRQLARMELFHGLSKTPGEFVERSEGPLNPRVGQGPIVIDGDDVFVYGALMPPLSERALSVIEALIEAFPNKLLTEKLKEKSGVPKAAEVLRHLCRSNAEWASVIQTPSGKRGQGFRIILRR